MKWVGELCALAVNPACIKFKQQFSMGYFAPEFSICAQGNQAGLFMYRSRGSGFPPFSLRNPSGGESTALMSSKGVMDLFGKDTRF